MEYFMTILIALGLVWVLGLIAARPEKPTKIKQDYK